MGNIKINQEIHNKLKEIAKTNCCPISWIAELYLSKSLETFILKVSLEEELPNHFVRNFKLKKRKEAKKKN